MIKFRIFLFLLPLSSLAENQQQSFPSPKNDVNSRSFQQSSSISSINSQDVKQSSSFSSSSSAHETDGTLRQSISSSAIGNPAVQSVMTQFVPASQLPNPQQQRHFQGSSSSLFQETTVPGFVSCGRGGSVITSDVQQTENGVPSGKMQMNVNGVMYNKGPVIAIGDQCVYHSGQITENNNTRPASQEQVEAIQNYLNASKSAQNEHMIANFNNPNFPFGGMKMEPMHIMEPMTQPPCFCRCCQSTKSSKSPILT